MADHNAPPSPDADDKREHMKRVRVGLTGLAVVLLLVALTTLIFSQVNQQMSPATGTAASEPQKGADEPLADLGVAPGAPENPSAPANPSSPANPSAPANKAE